MSKFQLIIIAVFVVGIIAGVVVFATQKSTNSSDELPNIAIWGTFSSAMFNRYVSEVNLNRTQALKINYTQIPEENFDQSFIEALARGNGPDAILIDQDMIYKHEDKIIPIPYTVLSQRDFQNTYIQQAELYLSTKGVLALPFTVNPIVMYWNRDNFTNAGLATYPKFWDEFTKLNTVLTQKDVNSNISRSAIAMGEFSNVSHAREVLSALFLQSGNPVTYITSTDEVVSALGSRSYSGLTTSLPALNFFNQFSNPANPNYSWNRSIPNSKNTFLSGGLATYFGFASEINDIHGKNPNLNFDVATIPQARGGKVKATYGTMFGFSIVKSSQNVDTTYSVVSGLTAQTALTSLIPLSYLPPVRRDMLASGTTDPYLSIFYNSALIARGWLDSNKVESNRILQSVVETVTSGRKNASDALQNGSDELDISLKNI